MARIPTITSEVDARTGRTTAGIPSQRASADAFGAVGGRGLQMLGAGLDNVAQGLNVYEEKKRQETVANKVATSDYTARELSLRNSAPPDASGYQETVLSDYDTWVDEQAEAIEDDKTREEYKRRMAAQRPQVSARSATYEFSTAAQYSEDQTNLSLASLDNRIRLQPDQFETLIAQGTEVINAATGLPATYKSAAATAWTQRASVSYFEGRLEGARDVEDVEAVMSDLQDEAWSSKLAPQGLESLINTATSTRTAIVTKTDADARAAIEFLEGRANDVGYIIPDEELRATQSIVALSANPATQARMARIARDQDILKSARKLTPDQQREVISAQPAGAGLPPVVAGAVNDAAGAFGVSGSYLAGMVGREYGGYLKGDPDAIDYGMGNAAGASGAVGVAQIIPSTMLALAGDPSVQAAVSAKYGIDMSTMTDAEKLELRKNPKVSIMLAGAYAAQNAAMMRPILGREPSDGELYMAHFLGGGGAVRLLKMMRANPAVSAADMMPEAAKANPTIFYKKDGSARNVHELYGVLGGTFSGSNTYVEYGDAQTREKLLTQTEERLANDPMNFANSVGNSTLTDITTPDGMAQRGKEARSVADYYNIPYETMKPFTETEASALGKAMAEGTADDVIEMLASVQQMGGAMAAAGMKQIGKLDDVYGYAGSLSNDAGQAATASDVVRGQKRIEENPDIKMLVGATDSDLSNAFFQATGGALFDLAPDQRQQIQKAALAHYVETSVARGKAGSFDSDAFTRSVNAVMGAAPGGTVVGEVNGEKTVLPPGVTGDMVEDAFGVMTVEDWSAMSEQRLPPRYVSGAVADPRDLADEAVLRSIGGGKYRVALDDGTYLVTGRPGQNGRLEAFIFTPDPKRLKSIAESASAVPAGVPEGEGVAASDGQIADVTAAQADGTITTEEMNALMSKYGATWAYDQQGNRIVPTQ